MAVVMRPSLQRRTWHHAPAGRSLRRARVAVPAPARSLAGAVTVAAIAVTYLVMAWWIVFTERWGPVVAVVDGSAGRGVHSGDMIGLACAGLGVLLAAVATVLLDRAVGPRAARRRHW